MKLLKRGRRWYLNVRVPTLLAGAVGKTHHVEALGTEDRKLARIRADARMIELRAEWRKIGLRQGIRPKHIDADDLAEALRIRDLIFSEDGDERDLGQEMLQDEAMYLEAQADARELPRTALIEFTRLATQRTTAELADQFLEQARLSDDTRKQYRNWLNLVAKDFPFIADASQAEVREWLRRFALTRSLSAVQNVVKVMRGLTRFHGLPDSWQIDGVKPAKMGMQRATYTPEDYARLLAVADNKMKLVYAATAHHGLRAQEVAGLKYDADRDHVIIRSEIAKTPASARRLPCHDAVREEVKAWASMADKLLDHTISTYHIRLMSKAGIQRDREDDLGRKGRLVFHGFRHSFAAQLASQGVEESLIGRALGHAPRTVTGRYSRGYDPEGLRPIVNLVRWS